MSEITFTPIPKWILKNRVLSASELYVYSFMYDGWNYARKQNRKYQISIKKLISEIGYDRKTILSAIEKMEKNEIFFVTRDKRDDNRDAKNIYEFNTKKVWVEKSPLTPNNSSTNESGENSQIRVEKSPLHTKENKEKKNNISLLSTSTKGSRVEETDNLKTDELTDNFSLNEIENKAVSEVEEPVNDQNININSVEGMTYYTDEELRACYGDAINEWKMIQESRYQNTENKDFKEVSEWVGKKLHRGYDLLKSLRASKTMNGVKAYISEIDEIITSYQKVFNTGRLTKKQEQAFLDFEISVDKAIADKKKYFNGGKTKQSQTVKNEENAETSTENEDIRKAAPAPVSANNDWNDFMLEAFS